MDNLGELIRHHRKRAGISRRKLALLADTGQTVIYELEHGKQTVRLDTMLKIIGALNMTMHVSGPFVNEFNRLNPQDDSNE